MLLIMTIVSDESSTKKILHFIWMSIFFKKIDINCVHMSSLKAMKTMIIARDNLTEWKKTRALFNFKINTIVKFIWQNVISQHECFDIAILNKNSKNKKIIKQLLQRYWIKIKIILFYHSMTNDMIKQEY